MKTVLTIAALLLFADAARAASDYSASVVTRADPRAQLAEQVDLFDRLCLQRFPDDAKVEADLLRRRARAMSPEELRSLLHDDPGTGWVLAARTASFRVTVEGPPYHACSVRTMTAHGYADLSPYLELRDRFERGGEFSPMTSLDRTAEGVMSHLEGEVQLLSGGVHETLMQASVQVADPKQRDAGDSNVEVRFVHQIVSPPDAPSS